MLNAQARLRWNGVSPRFMMGGASGSGANFLLPIPEEEITGQPRNALYDAALALRKAPPDEDTR